MQGIRAATTLAQAELFEVFNEIRSELVRLLRRRTGSADIAADLAQDLFVKLMTLRTELPDREQARAYIFRMASNIVIDRARMNTRRTQLMSGSEILFEGAESDPETVAVIRDQLKHVENALEELNPKCRQVLILARVHGLSHREIAEKLGVSISLVEKYKLRALRHCRQRLDF